MDEILTMIKIFLDADIYDATDFSIELEDALCEKYDELVSENQRAAGILNEELPDICAGYEIGNDIGEFKAKIKVEYEKVLEASE